MNVILGEDDVLRQGVLDEFFALCRYPHPSGGESTLADYLQVRLDKLGYHTQRDAANNLLAHIPATDGRENRPTVVLQGHIDMVCAVAPGSGYTPATDPIVPVVTGGVLRSDGRSSLGADNNLGNAALLYLLGQQFPHGPLRILFTTKEETGLEGAQQVAPDWLAGATYLINTDGFTLGQAVVSSAGGWRETYYRPLHTVPRQESHAFEISLTGFLGGHSGFDINRGRANPIKLMALFLGELRDHISYELAALTGGCSHNAIPMYATATIVAPRGAAKQLVSMTEKLRRSIAALYGQKDPGGQISLGEVPPPPRVWSTPCRDGAIDLMALLYTGVYAMHDDLPNQVSASSNLGFVGVAENQVHVDCFIRCSMDFSQEIIAFQHARAARLTGFQSRASGYPGWEGDGENRLVKTLAKAYRRLTRRTMEVTSVHVGLEPSVLGAKNPAMYMVSTGPDIRNPHSTDEHAPLAGLPTYVRLLAETLAGL